MYMQKAKIANYSSNLYFLLVYPSQHTFINSQTQTPTTISHSTPTIDATSQTSFNYPTGLEDNAISYASSFDSSESHNL